MCGWHSPPLTPALLLVGTGPLSTLQPHPHGSGYPLEVLILWPPSSPKARVRSGWPQLILRHNPLTSLTNRKPRCSPWTRRRISKQLLKLVSASSLVNENNNSAYLMGCGENSMRRCIQSHALAPGWHGLMSVKEASLHCPSL